MNDITFITVFLNKEKYQRNIGELPDCYIRGIVSGITGELNNENKNKLVREFWKRAGGTGGYKRHEKLNPDLFIFHDVH